MAVKMPILHAFGASEDQSLHVLRTAFTVVDHPVLPVPFVVIHVEVPLDDIVDLLNGHLLKVLFLVNIDHFPGQRTA